MTAPLDPKTVTHLRGANVSACVRDVARGNASQWNYYALDVCADAGLLEEIDGDYLLTNLGREMADAQEARHAASTIALGSSKMYVPPSSLDARTGGGR